MVDHMYLNLDCPRSSRKSETKACPKHYREVLSSVLETTPYLRICSRTCHWLMTMGSSTNILLWSRGGFLSGWSRTSLPSRPISRVSCRLIRWAQQSRGEFACTRTKCCPATLWRLAMSARPLLSTGPSSSLGAGCLQKICGFTLAPSEQAASGILHLTGGASSSLRWLACFSGHLKMQVLVCTLSWEKGCHHSGSQSSTWSLAMVLRLHLVGRWKAHLGRSHAFTARMCSCTASTSIYMTEAAGLFLMLNATCPSWLSRRIKVFWTRLKCWGTILETLLVRAQFDRMEKAVGIVHTMRGPLNCDHLLQRLNGGPISVTQMDWMHIYCVNGVFNTECGFLLESLRAAGLQYIDLDRYLQGFKYPKQLQSKGTTGSKTLKGYDGGDVKCSASEALAVYPCIRLMLMTLVPDDVPHDTTLAIVSFHALCGVLDLLQQDKKLGNVDPDTLHGAVERHVTFRIAAYGEDRQQPKVHWSLHLSSMKRLQPVLTCWVHERKHKEIKRVANDVANANRTVGFEKSMLTSVLLAQQEALKGLNILDGVALVNPKPANEAIAHHARIAAGRGILESVEHAHDALLGPGQLCASKDVAVATLQGADAVVEVWFHVLVANHVYMTVVSPWTPAGTNLFQKQDDPLFIPTSDIQRCCIYHSTPDPGVVAVVPWSLIWFAFILISQQRTFRPCVLWPGESCEKCDPACFDLGSHVRNVTLRALTWGVMWEMWPCLQVMRLLHGAILFPIVFDLTSTSETSHHLKRPLFACAAVCQVVPTQLHPHGDLLPGYILRHIYMWPWHSIKKIHLIRCMESYPKTHCELEDTICAIDQGKFRGADVS